MFEQCQVGGASLHKLACFLEAQWIFGEPYHRVDTELKEEKEARLRFSNQEQDYGCR